MDYYLVNNGSKATTNHIECMYNKMLDIQRIVLGGIHCNILSEETKTLVSTVENQKEYSCENISGKKKKKNITHLSEVMTFCTNISCQ